MLGEKQRGIILRLNVLVSPEPETAACIFHILFVEVTRNKILKHNHVFTLNTGCYKVYIKNSCRLFGCRKKFVIVIYVIIITIKCIYLYYNKYGILFYMKNISKVRILDSQWRDDDFSFTICRVIE